MLIPKSRAAEPAESKGGSRRAKRTQTTHPGLDAVVDVDHVACCLQLRQARVVGHHVGARGARQHCLVVDRVGRDVDVDLVRRQAGERCEAAAEEVKASAARGAIGLQATCRLGAIVSLMTHTSCKCPVTVSKRLRVHTDALVAAMPVGGGNADAVWRHRARQRATDAAAMIGAIADCRCAGKNKRRRWATICSNKPLLP